MADQLELDDAWPVLPKPPREVLLEVPLDVPGLVVAGVVVVEVVLETRVGVWVGVRLNAGRDQWLPLFVRVQLEPAPPVPQERRGGHPSGLSAPGTAAPVAAGGLTGAVHSRCGVMA